MPVSDERDDDEEIQPGDLVIEMIGGRPYIYTQPEREDSATARKAQAVGDLTNDLQLLGLRIRLTAGVRWGMPGS
jgi:hypothetical protein